MTGENFRPYARKIAFAFVDFIKKRPFLERRAKAISEWYCDKMGYRKYGLIKDDLIDDEHEVVQEAIKRLPPSIQNDRLFRLKRAVQVHLQRDVLPSVDWTPPEKDVHYLLPTLWQVCKERDEKEMLDKLHPKEFSQWITSNKPIHHMNPVDPSVQK